MKIARTIAIGLLVTLAAGTALAAGPVGFVAATKGDAQLVRGGEALEARVGLDVQQGDLLRTGAKSRLKVLLSDDSVLALGSKSEVEITSHLFAPAERTRTTRIRMLGGSLRALVQKAVAGNKADFEIRSGTAVAGVRGTEFAVLTEGDATRLVTFSGGVEWAAAGGEPVLVEAGQGSLISDGRASRPEALAAADLKAARRATDTVQAPTALAWNLAPTDRLGRGGPASATAGGALDQDSPEERGGPTSEHDYDNAKGRGADEWGGPVSEEHGFGGRYGGQPGYDDGDEPLAGLFTGEWDSSTELEPPSNLEHDFCLKIQVNR